MATWIMSASVSAFDSLINVLNSSYLRLISSICMAYRMTALVSAWWAGVVIITAIATSYSLPATLHAYRPANVAVTLRLQDVPAPPPGNPGHGEPAKGVYCENHTGATPAHACGCQRKCEIGEEGTLYITEDAKCRVYCHPKHCHCTSPGCP